MTGYHNIHIVDETEDNVLRYSNSSLNRESVDSRLEQRQVTTNWNNQLDAVTQQLIAQGNIRFSESSQTSDARNFGAGKDLPFL